MPSNPSCQASESKRQSQRDKRGERGIDSLWHESFPCDAFQFPQVIYDAEYHEISGKVYIETHRSVWFGLAIVPPIDLPKATQPCATGEDTTTLFIIVFGVAPQRRFSLSVRDL